MKQHQNTNKLIILDDGDFFELSKYQVQTVFEKGFDNKKYQEACELLEKGEYKTAADLFMLIEDYNIVLQV